MVSGSLFNDSCGLMLAPAVVMLMPVMLVLMAAVVLIAIQRFTVPVVSAFDLQGAVADAVSLCHPFNCVNHGLGLVDADVAVHHHMRREQMLPAGERS